MLAPTLAGQFAALAGVPATGGTFSGVVLFADGTSALPGVAFSGATGTGMFRSGNTLGWSVGGTQVLSTNNNGTCVSAGALGMNSGNAYIESGASGIMSVANNSGVDVASIGSNGVNGQFWTIQTVTSNVTLSTGGTTTTGPTIPAGAQVLDVTARVTTTITTAANWSIGVAGATTRYVNANSTLTAGTTALGIDNPRKYTAATDTVITTNANPGAGAIRITIHYFLATAPTS